MTLLFSNFSYELVHSYIEIQISYARYLQLKKKRYSNAINVESVFKKTLKKQLVLNKKNLRPKSRISGSHLCHESRRWQLFGVLNRLIILY